MKLFHSHVQKMSEKFPTSIIVRNHKIAVIRKTTLTWKSRELKETAMFLRSIPANGELLTLCNVRRRESIKVEKELENLDKKRS